ncbi:hypothetical protein CpipJ_CPIJ017890 [Culex quinquefasciatus]|uniref:Uncharacterized protein n=1 Tax=Culex quinquefasciatus TaxID=7176 RepID=B0XEK1_CULQU|nr:hypothetical protein CpipJ_CPIJ017890 [Culex quinquefasciatus]|eukprot:XP_001868073.1 hypothetical protein CpipJ_CPIJ017890 [Culex quinquefasciatus]
MVTESSNIWIRTASFLPPRDCDAEMLPSTPDGVLSEWIIRVPESVPMPELSSPLPPPPPPRADEPKENDSNSTLLARRSVYAITSGLLRQQTLAAASFSVVELLSTALPSSFSQSWLYHPHRVCC